MEEVLEGIDEAYGTLLRCFNDIIKPYMSFIGNLNMPIEIDGKEFTSFDSAVEHVKKTKKNIKDPEKYVATIERTKRKAKQLSARKVYVDDDEYEEANKRLDQLNQVGRNNPSLRSPLESPEAMDLEEEYIQSGVKINPSRKSSGKKIDLKLRRKLAKQLSAERKIYVRDDEYEKAKQRLRNLARVDRDNPSLRRPMQKPEAFELEEKYVQSGVKIDPSRKSSGKKIDRRLRKRLASLADEAAKRRIRETNLTGVPYGKENRKTKQIEHDEALRTYIEGAARKYNIKIRPPEGFPHPSSSKPKRKDFIRIIKAQLSARKNHLPRFLRDNDDEDDDDFPLTDKAVKRHWYLGHDTIPLRDRAAERKVKETNLTGVPYGIEDRKMIDIERDEEERTFFENAAREYPVDFYKNPIKIRPPEGFSYEPRFDLDILHTWMGNPHQSENAPRKPPQKHFIRIIKAKIQNAKEQLIAKEHEHQVVFKKAGKKGIYKSASLVSNDGIFAKYWLLNAKQVNGNGWGVDPQTIKQNIIKFRGRPFVITAKEWIPNSEYGETYEHPYLPTNDINEILTHQAKFRVGNIVDVFEDKNGDWYASIQIQSKYANYRLPPFCSPAIFQLDPSEPEGSISKWEALHLAGLMEDPAYGARIALLKGTCIGNSNSCSVQFKGAKQLNRTNNSRSKIAEREDPILGRTSKLKSKLVRLANQRFAAPIIQETGEGITFRKIRPFSQPDIKKFGDYKIPMRPDNAFLIRPHNPDYSVKIMKELRKIQNTELPRFTHGTTGQNSIRIRDVGNLSVLGYPLRRQSTISHALGKTLQKGDILFRRVGAQPVDQYTYGAVGDTFHIDEEIPNASPFNLPKPRYSKLQTRLALKVPKYTLHPEHYEIESHAEKILGISPEFHSSHFLTSDGKLLGNGKKFFTDHVSMSYEILRTYNDPEFKKIADVVARGFEESHNAGNLRYSITDEGIDALYNGMEKLLNSTGMARVGAEGYNGMWIQTYHPLTKSQLSTINEHIESHNLSPESIAIDDYTPSQNTIKRQLRLGQLQYKYAGMRDVIKAFMEKKPLVSGNHKTDGKAYFLFGHEIARHEGSGLSVTNAGYPTPTTYNTLADIGVDFRIIKGVTYVEGKPYNDGDHVLIPYKNLKPREPKPKKTNSDGKDHSMSFKMRRFIRDVRKEQGNVSQLSITPDEQRMINKITGVNTPIPKPVPGTEGHHIFTREVFPELGFVKNNIITVSRSEHKEIHDLNRHITDKSLRRKRKKLKSKIAALIKEHPIVSNLRKIKNVGTYGSLFIADDGAILGDGISTHYSKIFSPSINPDVKHDKNGFLTYNNRPVYRSADFQKIMQDTRLIRMNNSPRELNLDVYASPTTSQIKTMRDLTIPPYNRSDFYVHINSHVPELPETRLYRMLGVGHYSKQIKTKFAHDYTPDDVGGLGGAMTPEQRARALHLVDVVQKNRKLQEFINSPEGREANRLYVNKGIKINPKKWLEKTRRQEAKIICPKKLKEKISKIKLARSRYIIQQPQHVKINPQHGQIIANAYDALKHEPNNPEVKSAYDAFIRETEQQFEGLIKGGLKIKRIGDNVKPYSSSSELHADLAEKNELRYFPTVAGYGQGSEPKDHPMLRPTRFKDPVTNQTLLANDVFRIVHDVRGHHIGGLSGFGPTGEQRAFLTHSKDYSPLARKALFTETTAQTNWIVFSKQFGRLNRLNPEKMRYPQQKAGILPRDILEGVFHT